MKKLIRRVLIAIFAAILAGGVVNKYLPDWRLMAGVEDGEIQQETEITDEESIEIDSRQEGEPEKEDTADAEKTAETDDEDDASASDDEQADTSDNEDTLVIEENVETENTIKAEDTEDGASASDDEHADTPDKTQTEAERIGEVVYKGEDYTVTVTDSASMLPADTALKVTEILPDSDDYEKYSNEARSAVGDETGEVIGFARFFDITLVSGGTEFEPESPVSVSIEFGRKLQKEMKVNDDDTVRVLHFEENPNTDDINATILDDRGIDVKVRKDKLEEAVFEAESFSVYAVVSTQPGKTEETVEVSEFSELSGNEYYLSVNRDYKLYFTNRTTGSGPVKIGNTRNIWESAMYRFDPAEGGSGFRLSTADDNGGRLYIMMTANGANGEMALVSDESEATVFAVEKYNSGYYIYMQSGSSKYGLNRFGGVNSAGFAGWNGKDAGSCILLSNKIEGKDLLGLDGSTYALINFQSDVSGYVMMADKAANGRLVRKKTLIKENPLTHEGRLFIAEDADAPMWTFHAVDGNVYYLTTVIDGATRFLSVKSSGLSLVSDYDDSCNIIINQGTGGYAGKFMLAGSDGSVVRMHANSDTNGFGTTTAAPNANDYFSLAVKHGLKDEDFVNYTAKKVSASDKESVTDGAQIIVYTRIWNDTSKRYEFYAIDHDGSLQRVYENGDNLNWLGTRANTVLWDFTEYSDESTGKPNYYYDLKNVYSGKYLSPEIKNNRILSDDKPGLNLNGRRYRTYATTILTWDDESYEYSGICAGTDGLKAVPLDSAGTFYFAVMDKAADRLTTVNTVDSKAYGISMKMIDYNGHKLENGKLDELQNDVMGDSGNTKGLVTSYIGDNGYPTAVRTGRSLSELFDGATDANHLFLESIYKESGYFEYNCTENFAHFVADGNDKWAGEGYRPGDFVVYDQVGTIETGNVSLWHGQFMPYNDLEEGKLSAKYLNQTTETDATLPYSDPEKDKILYTIPYNTNKAALEDNNADYHFGMDMSAGFSQTADGLDAWGHDIIFEFAGDDDMFFYVDGMLVLDLGGIHAAQTGKVNFRTGQVNSSRGNSNLRDLFKAGYKAQNPGKSDQEVTEWLKTIFKTDAKGNVQTVFRDYSSHTMRMIYMERGAGASNLHMRFNLAAVKPGTVILGKTLSGVEDISSVNAEFPYQIMYKTKADGEKAWHMLGEKTGDKDLVKYVGRDAAVKYADSYSVRGTDKSYDHVFLLRPGESAEITMPDDTTEYKTIECGLNTGVYDQVSVNGTVVEPYGSEIHKDFATSAATVDERQTVAYDNHVNENALKNLTITKKLYDVSNNRISGKDDRTRFSFRLYLSGENDEELVLADTQPYCVRDDAGNYCKWDSSAGTFASLGKSDFGRLTDKEKKEATFHTSIYGAISKIPVDYTVEFRQILAGSKFKVEERDSEIPPGYSRKGYTREDIPDGESANEGFINENIDPAVVVENYKGWGLTVKKRWSDAGFTSSHDTIYFAVYAEKGQDSPMLIEDTVMAMPSGKSSVYWYFEKLMEGFSFDDYKVREVVLTGGFSVGEDYRVTGYTSIEPVNDGGGIDVSARLIYEDREETYNYTASYEQGSIMTEQDNIRTDIVTNSRPGIDVIKTAWDGKTPLRDAAITIKDEDGRNAGRARYVSGEDGFVTTLYLPDGRFILSEASSPKGYTGLSGDIEITKKGDNISLAGADSDEYSYKEAVDGSNAIITIKNRALKIKAVKTDTEGKPVKGVHFGLFRQIKGSDGELIRDYNAVSGYGDLISERSGAIFDISSGFGAGTYYIAETETPPDYVPLSEDICFTISSTGTLSMEDEEKPDRGLEKEVLEDGTVSYTIRIVNSAAIQKLRLRKVDTSDTGKYLSGAEFDLYRVGSDGKTDSEPQYAGLASGKDGFMVYEDSVVIDLPAGTYKLVETKAPDGYNLKTEPVVISVSSGGVQYDEQTTLSASGSGVIYSKKDNLYTLLISNTAGVILPHTGGSGTGLVYIAGIVLIMMCGAAYLKHRKNCRS